MNKSMTSMVGGAMMIAALGLAAPALSLERLPMTPELAAKREVVRKQEEQRIGNAQRKAAADALRAERQRLRQAKQAEGLAPPEKQGK